MVHKKPILILVAAVLLVPAPAKGGGGALWRFEGHGSFVEPVFESGEEVHASTKLFLSEVGPKQKGYAWWGGPQQGPFFGYVVARHGTKWPFAPPLPDSAIPVGQVRFSNGNDRSINVTLDFVVPELEPGTYVLLHCNDPCTRLIGTTMAAAFSVVESQGQAFIANRLNRVERQLLVGRSRLADRVRTLEKRSQKLKTVVGLMEDKVDSLEQAASSTRRDLAPPTKQANLPWVLFAAAAVGLILALRHRPGPFFSSESTRERVI